MRSSIKPTGAFGQLYNQTSFPSWQVTAVGLVIAIAIGMCNGLNLVNSLPGTRGRLFGYLPLMTVVPSFVLSIPLSSIALITGVWATVYITRENKQFQSLFQQDSRNAVAAYVMMSLYKLRLFLLIVVTFLTILAFLLIGAQFPSGLSSIPFWYVVRGVLWALCAIAGLIGLMTFGAAVGTYQAVISKFSVITASISTIILVVIVICIRALILNWGMVLGETWGIQTWDVVLYKWISPFTYVFANLAPFWGTFILIRRLSHELSMREQTELRTTE